MFLKQKIAIVLFYHLLFILATKCFYKPKKKNILSKLFFNTRCLKLWCLQRKLEFTLWKCTYGITPASIYLLKVNNRKTKTRCETCSNLTIKTPERRHWHQIVISFYYSKIHLFLFSQLIMIHWKQKFLKTMQSHWKLIYYRTIENYFSPSVAWLWFQLIQKYLSKELINASNRKRFSSIIDYAMHKTQL